MKKTAVSILLVFLMLGATLLAAWKISNSRSFQFFGGIVQKVETKEKVVALTFDDGPTKKTEEILEILEGLNVKATFFVTGRELNQNLEEGKK